VTPRLVGTYQMGNAAGLRSEQEAENGGSDNEKGKLKKGKEFYWGGATE